MAAARLLRWDKKKIVPNSEEEIERKKGEMVTKQKFVEWLPGYHTLIQELCLQSTNIIKAFLHPKVLWYMIRVKGAKGATNWLMVFVVNLDW